MGTKFVVGQGEPHCAARWNINLWRLQVSDAPAGAPASYERLNRSDSQSRRRSALPVEAGLLDKASAERYERVEEDVDLVQRVLNVELGVELELEVDPVRAGRDLEEAPSASAHRQTRGRARS